MKNGRNYTFWPLFGDLYRYNLSLYRYIFVYGHFLPSCTGTTAALFPVSTSFRILAITSSFLIRFECFKWLRKKDFKENKTYIIGIDKFVF